MGVVESWQSKHGIIPTNHSAKLRLLYKLWNQRDGCLQPTKTYAPWSFHVAGKIYICNVPIYIEFENKNSTFFS